MERYKVKIKKSHTFPKTLSWESCRTQFLQQQIMTAHTVQCHPGKPDRHSGPQFYWGGWSCRHTLPTMATNTRLPEGKQLLSVNPIVCTEMYRASLSRQGGGNPPESQVSRARLMSRPFKRQESQVCSVSPVALGPPRGPLRGLRPLQDLSEKHRQICSHTFISSDVLFPGCQSFSQDLFATLHLTQILPTDPTPPFPGSATLAGWVLWSAWPLGVSMEDLWPLLL